MPAFVTSEPSISFWDYFNDPLPGDVFEDFPQRLTHLADNIKKFLSPDTSLYTNKKVLRPVDISSATSILESFPSVREPILQVQAFETEQDVCDAFHSHVLAKVVPALSKCLATFYRESPESSDASKSPEPVELPEPPKLPKPSFAQVCKEHGYCVYQESEVRIKLQQDRIDTQQRHSDNAVFFGPIEKIAASETTVVVAAENFKRRLKYAISLQNAGRTAEIQWPVLALFIVEAKAAGIVKGSPWDETWNSEMDNSETLSQEVRNVLYILPQLRLYSRDACCPYIFLTDYLETVFFFVKDDGLETLRTQDGVTVCERNKLDETGKLYVEQSYNDRGVKLLLFATGLKVLRKVLEIK